MRKCDCYRVESEIHCFVDENGVPIYESINVPRCLGTKEKDVCDCGGDKLKCNFYERVRAEAAEEKKNLSTTKNVLEEIEDLIFELRREEKSMKKILENTAETHEYLESLPKVYTIARWAGYGIREFPFTGKCAADGVPFVWTYDDCNGTCDCYFLRKLTDTTTGWIYAWTTSKSRAEEIAAALNEKVGEGWRNK